MHLMTIAFIFTFGFSFSAYSTTANKELLITDLSVVDSYDAKFGIISFKGMFDFLANNKLQSEQILKDWINNWSSGTGVIGTTFPPRPKVKEILFRWPKRPDGKLDWNRAPFRLNAIINRLDLAQSELIGEAGQIRFIYQMFDQNRRHLPFMIIFEYTVPGDKNLWAHRWHHLASLKFGDDFRIATIKLVRDIMKEIRSTENLKLDIKTGENMFSPSPEMRLFHWDSSKISVIPILDRTTPGLIFSVEENSGGRMTELTDWIKNNSKFILSKFQFEIPEKFWASHNPVQNFKWASPLENDPAFAKVRSKFARNTCNGCHSFTETGTVVMMGDRDDGKESTWSPFLSEEVSSRSTYLEELLKQSFKK